MERAWTECARRFLDWNLDCEMNRQRYEERMERKAYEDEVKQEFGL